MNHRMLLYLIGKILRIEGVLMVPSLIVAVIYGESSTYPAFAFTIGLLIFIGTLLSLKKPDKRDMGAKEGFVIVGLAWILMSVFGALPFFISGEIPNYMDCIFETVSGFTTTGASILKNVEIMSKGLLFWRSFTHWVGGMGVLVFVLAILPRSDSKSTNLVHLMRAEVPGPKFGKISAKLKQTARILYALYIVFTLAEVVMLLCGGLSLYDSLTLSFGTAGTGGFSVTNESIATYGNAYAEYVIGAFMILFSINFNLFYLIIIGKFATAFKSEELWCYLGIIAASVGVITIDIMKMCQSFAESIRLSFFQVASIISTTGFSTTDFDAWPALSKAILVAIMFCGACTGSTGGGIKIGRIIILIKSGLREIRYILHPRSVKPVRYEGKALDDETVRGASSFFIVYMLIFVFSVLGVLVAEPAEFDLVSGFTSVSACLNNIGPGLSKVGPMCNYGDLSLISKIILSFDMLAGRLEVFPIIMIFTPISWRKR